jgi:hypothetical protein
MTTTSPANRLTKTEAARFLAKLLRGDESKPFTAQAMNKWMRERGMPHFKFGRQVTFDPGMLESWALRTFARNHRPTSK